MNFSGTKLSPDDVEAGLCVCLCFFLFSFVDCADEELRGAQRSFERPRRVKIKKTSLCVFCGLVWLAANGLVWLAANEALFSVLAIGSGSNGIESQLRAMGSTSTSKLAEGTRPSEGRVVLGEEETISRTPLPRARGAWGSEVLKGRVEIRGLFLKSEQLKSTLRIF